VASFSPPRPMNAAGALFGGQFDGLMIEEAPRVVYGLLCGERRDFAGLPCSHRAQKTIGWA
jgi:hypothetical protein